MRGSTTSSSRSRAKPTIKSRYGASPARSFPCSNRVRWIDWLGIYPDQESIVPASYLPVVTIIHAEIRPAGCRKSGADIISSLLPRLRNESEIHRALLIEAYRKGQQRRCRNRRRPTRSRLRQRRQWVPPSRTREGISA